MSRPSKEHYFMSLALLAAQRASCPRRKVGCVLVDKHSHVVSTGYNGPPSGEQNCTENPCGGHNQPSGQGLSLCRAIHAEINAFNQAGERLKTVTDMFLTAGPCCPLCTDTFLTLYKRGDLKNLKRMYFFDKYPSDTAKVFKDLGIELIHVDQNLDTNGFLFKLAVTLGFRQEYKPENTVLCIGGVLHGCSVVCNGMYLRADATSADVRELENLKLFDSSGIFPVPHDTVPIHEYYMTKFHLWNGTIKIMQYVGLSDNDLRKFIHDFEISNLGRPIFGSRR